jgi:hypothetical protein
MAINEAVNIGINVDGTASVEKAANSYEDLGDAVSKTQREAERLALQYGINDVKTQEAIATAAKYKRELADLDTVIELNASSMELLVSVTQSLVGGFSAAVGAAALFGGSSEDLTRVLTRVQAALALTEGLNNLQTQLPRAVTGLTAKFRTLNITLRTTSGLLKGLGIGALLVGIGLLLKNIEKVVAKLKEWGDALGITNFALEAQVKVQAAVNKNIEREIALLEAQGKSQDVILKKRIEAAKEAKRLADLELELAQFRKEGVEEAEQAQLDAINNIAIAEANLTTFNKEQLKERQKAQQEFNQQMFTMQFEEYLQNKERLKNLRDLDRVYQAESKNQVQENRLLRQIELEKQFKEERDMLENALDMELITQEQYDELSLKQNDNHKKKLIQSDREYAQAKRDIEEQTATEVSQMLLDLNSVFQGQRENQNRQEFEREKALSIAQTLISTYFAAQRAYASQLTATPDSPIRAAIAAAAAITGGLARVAAIRRVKFNDPNASDTASAVGSTSAVPRFQAPSTRIPGGGDEFTQVRRVYVTERDITNVQDKVKVTESLSQF